MRVLAIGAVIVCASLAGLAQERADAPLPDAATFFAKAREKLATNEILQTRYTFKERTTELKLNPLGRMGSGPPLVYEVYPSVEPTMTYRRLVERDGTPIPKSELDAADRDYRARYQAWRTRLQREGANEREARLKRQAEVEARARAQAKEVLDLFTFRLERRERLTGEPAIVVRFQAREDARPRSREGRVAAVFVGQVWIHEHEHEVMQLEATAMDDVAFGFGMVARLNKDAVVSLARQRHGSVWLPRETRFKGAGRALMLRRVTIDYVREYFDYRPYDPTEPPPIPGFESRRDR